MIAAKRKDGDTAQVVLRFVAALIVGGCGGAAFHALGTPLPWLLGAMVACAAGAIAGLPLQASAAARRPMAAVMGVVLGSAFHPGLFEHVAAWAVTIALLPLYLGSAALVCVHYFRRIARYDPVTAYFAGMPGGIAEMVVMSAERGADERLIGLIHGARIFLVVLILPFLIRLFHAPGDGGLGLLDDAGSDAGWTLLLWAAGCIALGLALGSVLKLPAWHLVGPLAVSAAIHLSGISDFRIPVWVISTAQVGLGATIGCRFVGLSIAAIGRTILIAAGSTALLLGVTCLWALGIAMVTRIDPVLVTLAYSPGGLAEMSMVALSLSLESGFVVVHHLFRVIIVLLGAPLFARRAT